MSTSLPRPMARLRDGLRGAISRLSPRQRQFAMLGAILLGGVGVLWAVFASSGSAPSERSAKAPAAPTAVTHIGVMPPGQQVNPVDQWVGTAGNKLAQYEAEREEQTRLNKDRQAFEAQTMKRFADLEQRLTSSAQATAAQPTPSTAPVASPTPAAQNPPPSMPPAASLPPPPPPRTSPVGLPPGNPGAPLAMPPMPVVPALSRITVTPRERPADTASSSGSAGTGAAAVEARTVSTFLPVSFTRGVLLGGLDAPTGGQAQSNPHPVLIRLSDDAVLPNRFRGQYRECFVIAAGYGDISAERAYLRTESLSCVRHDGATLEVRIQGSVYGEDGKVGMRGRLVTKQGQLLANALLAGVVSGIGQGVATASTSYSTSALGTIATTSGSDAFRAGIGSGVGKALDRLASYYIKLAENTFPVIEIDAGREIDVVITKGVRIDVPLTAAAAVGPMTSLPRTSTQEAVDDGNY